MNKGLLLFGLLVVLAAAVAGVAAANGDRSRSVSELMPPMPAALKPRPLAVVGPAPTNKPAVILSWSEPDLRFEVWHSTDLRSWELLTNLPCDLAVRLPAEKSAEYFRVRTVDALTGATSDWGTR